MPHAVVCACGNLHAPGQRCPTKTRGPKPNGRHGSTRRWRHTRDRILRRDGHACQVCGSERRLEVHHLDGNWRNNDETNLETRCFDHNPRGGKAQNR